MTSTNIAANAVTSSEVKNGSLLAKDFKAGQLPKGATGDQGPGGAAGAAGAPGAKGDKGDPATALFASVNNDGSLRRGSGVVKSERFPFGQPTGDYLVTFDRDISGCAWTGTLVAHDSGSLQNGAISLNGFASAPAARSQLSIQAPGNPGDFSFDIAVFC